LELHQVDALQYEAAKLDREEAAATVALLNIDLLLARISLDLQK